MRAVLMLVITWMILSPEIVTKTQAAPARANRVSVSYVPPKNPAHQPILDQLREVGFLEKFQKFLTPFRLPRALLVKVEGCDGDANAFYENSVITICYEYIELLRKTMPAETTAAGVTPIDAIVGPLFDTGLHEFAHALLANELDEGWSIRLPVRRKALEVFEDGVDAVLRKECHSILGVFVKIGVEDALIHEVGLPFDREENPAQVVQLEHCEAVRLVRYGLLDVSGVLVEYIFPARDDLGDDGEAIARRTLGKDRAVSALLHLIFEDPSFRDRHRRRSGPVALLGI